MTPDEVVAHPATQAVRHPDFSFACATAVRAECAVCGLALEAPPGRSVVRPCGRSECAFSVVAPRSAGDLGERPLVAGAVLATNGEAAWQTSALPVERPAPPPPPRSGSEWTARAAEIAARAPDIGRALGEVPIGWFGLLELTAHALDARGLGGSIATRQVKEKHGIMRWYAAGDPAALAVAAWAEAMGALTCARDGTPDGRLAAVGGWWVTLGAAARSDLAWLGPRGWRAATEIYPSWARSTG